MNIKLASSILVSSLSSGCCLLHQAPPLGKVAQNDAQQDQVICKWMDSLNLTTTDLQKDFRNFKDDISVNHDYLYCNSKTDKPKPPVILLHEILGVNEKTKAYAEVLAKDFTVYVPRFFGERDTGNSFLRGAWNYKFTYLPNNDEWEQKHKLENSMLVTQWLKKFIKTVVEEEHPDDKISVIGNCLTGALPLTLLDNHKVTKVVLAQPTLPIALFKSDEDLEISEKEWQTAKARINPELNCKQQCTPARAYLTRFTLDSISPIEKYEHLIRELSPTQECSNIATAGSNLLCNQVKKAEYEYGEKPKNVDHCAHSVLIGDWQPDDAHPSEIRRKEVNEFLFKQQN